TTKLMVIGRPDLKHIQALKQVAAETRVEEMILWTGLRRDIPRLLGGLDVFALPTLEDQIPLCVLEAMASSLPVVTTRVGGLPECIQSGVDGILVPAGNSQQLADALIEILGNPSRGKSLGAAARRRVERDFSCWSVTNRVEDLLDKVRQQRSQGLENLAH